MTWKQLGMHDKPILLINFQGFWDPLLAMIAHQAAAGYIRPQHTGLFTVVRDVEAAFDALAKAPEPCAPADAERL